MSMREQCRVPIEQLRRSWDPADLGFACTDELPELAGLVGQERAVAALHFGLKVRSPGYNIYVAGPSGTGKTSYTTALLKAHAETEPMAQDWVYVHNFDRPDEPIALALPSGGAPTFAREMDELVADARRAAVRALGTKEHQDRREGLARQIRMQISQMMNELEELARDSGFALAQTEQGLMPIPTKQGQPLTEEQFAALPPETQQELQEKGHSLRARIIEAARRTFELEKGLQQELYRLDSATAGIAMAPVILTLKEKYKHLPRVHHWLTRVERELVGHALPAAPAPSPAAEEAAASAMGLEGAEERRPRVDPLARFRVNVLVHQSRRAAAPVVVEHNPTYFNLFGKAELAPGPDGSISSGVMQIKAGSLHRANGGYLVLQVMDLLRHPPLWETLKRSLTTREARVEMPEQENRIFPVHLIRPQPIPLNVKVILIGPSPVYQMLYMNDEGFRKLFKVKAEFDVAMEATPENVKGYAAFVAQVCRKEQLRHLKAEAVAQVVEQSHRLANDQSKLSARFNEVVELIYEANAWAAQEDSTFVEARHIDRAVAEKAERASLPERRLQAMIERGQILVDVDGRVVGQVNGLTVMNVGDHGFGSPSRITARTYTGHTGILHIEREIEMTGQIHDKGLLTLSGFLGDRFAQNKPLAFSASIAFEQTYVPVDGDSASSTELYALLSALADAPIDQGIAVTGSVNQRGEVQVIGGVNEKVEGFYQICKLKGLTGRQGVMIPRQNLINLMLSEEVVEAVRAGRFQIWVVGTIEEGIEILTGLPAGERGPDGAYPEGSLFARVDQRIREYGTTLAEWRSTGQ